MISEEVLGKFQVGLDKLDEELKDFKKVNEIDKPFYFYYSIKINLTTSEMEFNKNTPDFIVQKIEKIYSASL